MSDENQTKEVSKVVTDKGGRPPGYPKSGGRQAGTPNKRSLWLSEKLEEVQFDFAVEFKKAFDANDFTKVAALQSLLPYLAPKFKERDPEPAGSGEAPPMASIPTADLLAIAKGNK